MRKSVWIALAVLLGVLLTLFAVQPQHQEADAAQPPPGPISFGIRKSALSDADGGKVGVLSGYLYPESVFGSLQSFCSDSPPPRSVLLLEHASVPGAARELGAMLSDELSKCGQSSQAADLRQALSSKNAVVIFPGGAVPAGLAEGRRALAEAGVKAIIIESLGGRRIDSEGNLAFGNGSGFDLVHLEIGLERQAAQQAARLALVPLQSIAGESEIGGGNFTLAAPASHSSRHCRLVFISDDGRCRFADSGEMAAPEGSLLGPSSLLSGERGQFEFHFQNGSHEVGKDLELFAAASLGGREAASTPLASGRVREGLAIPFAASFQDPGHYSLEVKDQYGRMHASAYVEVKGLEAALASSRGNRYEYAATFSGEPANGLFEVRLDGGEPKKFSAQGGRLTVWAEVPQGEHTIEFSHKGATASLPIKNAGGGIIESYVKLGAVALLFLSAVFLLLGARKKAIYTISFPELARAPMRRIEASGGEFAAAWEKHDRQLGGHSLPATASEIGQALLAMRHLGKGHEANGQSSSLALQQLCESGRFLEHRGYFIPAGKSGGMPPSQLYVLRMLHDWLLEAGRPFERKSPLKIPGAAIEILAFGGKGGVASGLGKNRRLVAFSSSDELGEFMDSLSKPTAENARIRLAISTGKILPVVASRGILQQYL